MRVCRIGRDGSRQTISGAVPHEQRRESAFRDEWMVQRQHHGVVVDDVKRMAGPRRAKRKERDSWAKQTVRHRPASRVDASQASASDVLAWRLQLDGNDLPRPASEIRCRNVRFRTQRIQHFSRPRDKRRGATRSECADDVPRMRGDKP